jgi:acetyl esterase/lipase
MSARLLLSFALLAISAAGASILAQAPGSPFDRWDANGDGRLVREELPEPLRRNFERVDANRDGFVSREEDAAVRRNRPDAKGKGKGAQGAARLPEGVKKLADLDYAGTGNPRHTLDLYLPENPAAEGPLPVVVFIHGGGWQNGDKNGGGGRVAPLVATGKFAGASIGYRLSGEAQWPAQIHDCKAAIRWIKAHAKEHGLDPDRVAVWGSSAGGHLVAMLGVSDGIADLEGSIGAHAGVSSKVKCVVDFFGPADLLTMGGKHDDPASPESKLIGGPVQENPGKARTASPAAHVGADDAPFLIVHGDEDPLVPYGQSVALETKLEAAGVPAVLLTVAGGGHGQGFGETVTETVAAYLGWQLLGEGRDLSDRTVKAGE